MTDDADTVRDGLDAYWETPSEYHDALDRLVAERDTALRTVETLRALALPFRDLNVARANLEMASAQALPLVEAERDRLRAALERIADTYVSTSTTIPGTNLPTAGPMSGKQAQGIARAALAGEDA